MKKSFLCSIFVLLFVMILLSCPDKVKKVNVKFISYDDKVNVYPQDGINKQIAIDTIYKDLSDKPTAQPFDIGNKRYKFKGWTDEIPSPETEIMVDIEVIDDNTKFIEDITYYAVYTTVDLTIIKAMYWNDGYKQLGDDIKFEGSEIKFKDAKSHLPSTVDETVNMGVLYTFASIWDKTDTPDVMVEDFMEITIDDESILTNTVNLYACYTTDEYLTFTAIDNTTISFNIEDTLSNPISLQYRKDGEKEFTDYTWGETNKATSGNGLSISLNSEDIIYFRGDNSTFSQGTTKAVVFNSGTGKVKASGSVMSLLNTRDTIPTSYCFSRLFRSSNITEAPALPATNLTEGCYYMMFAYARELVKAPELPADTLAKSCYHAMFRACNNVNFIPPKLTATTLAEGCYNSMFNNCVFIEAPELTARNLAKDCYNSMFENCVNLTTPPELPATKLSNGCYRNMFGGCYNIIEAPLLPATTLIDNCYYHMFNGCAELQKIEIHATDISATNALLEWVKDVYPNGTFICFNGDDWPKGESGIPSLWVIEEAH